MKTKISGFSFVHNAFEGGYPIFEAIIALMDCCDDFWIVDMKSTDGTVEALCQFRDDYNLDLNIIDGEWIPGGGAGGIDSCLGKAHALNVQCSGDVIVNFEADEVYDRNLALAIRRGVHLYGIEYAMVYRIQIEQNFQRARWYPELVHRVFPKGSTIKHDHTTDLHSKFNTLPNHRTYDISVGLLWDVTFNFRDNLANRIRNNAELYGGKPSYKMTPYHFTAPYELSQDEMSELMSQPHWEYTGTPFNIPDVLKPLVGMTSYPRNYEESLHEFKG